MRKLVQVSAAALSVAALIALSVVLTAWTHGGGGGGGGGQFNIAASRTFPWGNQPGFASQTPPGVTYNGGIPLRTTITATLSPCTPVGTCNDAVQINTAMNTTCPGAGGGVVKLNPGVYNIVATNNGNSIPNPGSLQFNFGGCTLRGSGPGAGQMITPAGQAYSTSPIACGAQWAGVVPPNCTPPFSAASPGTSTYLFRYDYAFDTGSPTMNVGGASSITGGFTSGILLTADALKTSTSLSLASVSGISANQLLYLDQITDNNNEVYFDNNMNPGGGNRCQDQQGHCQCPVLLASMPSSAGSGVLHFSSVPSWLRVGMNPVDKNNGSMPVTQFHVQTFTSTTVTLDAGSILAPGVSTNDPIYFGACARTISQMIKVKTVNTGCGTTPCITIFDPLSYDFLAANSAEVVIMDGVAGNNNAPVGIGIEELSIFGGAGGDYGGNIVFNFCDSCWARHVDCAWADGQCIGMYSTYKNEVRDSFLHEAMYPLPGGGGYLSGISVGGFGNLYENNIMWAGDKNDVVRNGGGGNVFGYNYMDDTFLAQDPDTPEAGLNAAHYTTSHMDLLEGNYTSNFKGDSFWGNSIYITTFRNWLAGKRAIHGNLANYTSQEINGFNCTFGLPNPTGFAKFVDGFHVAADIQGGSGVTAQAFATSAATSGSTLTFANGVPGGIVNGTLVGDAINPQSILPGTVVTGQTATTVTISNAIQFNPGSGINGIQFDDWILFVNQPTGGTTGAQLGTWNNNFVGNILGTPGQSLNPTAQICIPAQTAFTYESIGGPYPVNEYIMWGIGIFEDTVGAWYSPAGSFQTNTQVYTSQLRQGNYDFVTNSTHWFTNPIGSMGASTGSPMTLANSLYLTSTPQFFTNYGYSWPWIDGPSGSIGMLPAQQRFLGNITGGYAVGANTPNACMNYDSTNGVCLD